MTKVAPVHDRPAISEIAKPIGKEGATLYVGGAEGARDLALLRELGITTVVNCAVNLDINYVGEALLPAEGEKCAAGHAPVRSYKIGMIDGDGNPETMMLAGYYILDGAIHQTMPDKPSYPMRERGNILVHCRGGRSRSVALVALYLHVAHRDRFPTLEAAIDHVRVRRELHEDEWFETPKPVLINAARRAAEAIERLNSAS